MIKIDSAGRAFDGFWAVRGLSLEVPRGEVFGLLGPNGAGKTTTIGMMTGLVAPTEGALYLGGHDIVQEPIKAKSILGYVPDRAFFYEKLTAREFLKFVASLRGMEKPNALKRVQEMSELFGMADYEDEPIEGYSQGMKQRLLFASALVHSPEVLIIDEPFVGLDPFGVALVKDVIRDMSQNSAGAGAGGGAAVFLATHSLHIAAELCDRVGFISKGALVGIKHRSDVLAHEGGLEGLFMEGVAEQGEQE